VQLLLVDWLSLFLMKALFLSEFSLSISLNFFSLLTYKSTLNILQHSTAINIKKYDMIQHCTVKNGKLLKYYFWLIFRIDITTDGLQTTSMPIHTNKKTENDTIKTKSQTKIFNKKNCREFRKWDFRSYCSWFYKKIWEKQITTNWYNF